MTNAYCTLADVKTSLAGDQPNMSSARDQSLVDKILEISRDIDRHISLCRGEPEGLFSFLAEQQFGQQIVYLSSTPKAVAGTFRLSFKGEITTTLAYNATNAAVQAALEALSTVGASQVVVTGFDGGPYTVDFADTLTGPQDTMTGSSELGQPDSAIVVLPMIQGVTTIPSERKFQSTPACFGFLLPIDDCASITEVRLYTDATTFTVFTDYTLYPLRGLPIEGIKRVDGKDWPESPLYVGVLGSWGHSTEIPYDVRETTIIEVIRSHFSGQAGNDDRLGMTPFGKVITSKAFTDKFKYLKYDYGKKLW